MAEATQVYTTSKQQPSVSVFLFKAFFTWSKQRTGSFFFLFIKLCDWHKYLKKKSVTKDYKIIRNTELIIQFKLVRCVKNQKLDIHVQKAEVKVKLVTDTYMLQYHQDKFSHKENAGFWQICNDGVEDIKHFILKCKPPDEVRQNKLEQFKRTVEDIKGGGAELLEEKN